ncbi:hypothetical protein [Streptomyces albogriseolus]|uniref:hypothetical protein n=1 Tax=Streptomyces albogriseolus TaxID=1887 RepID=UPI0033A99B45
MVKEGVANFLNVTLPCEGPSAARRVRECRRPDIYLRDLSPLSPLHEGRTVRVAVTDTTENARVVAAYGAALETLRTGPHAKRSAGAAAAVAAGSVP